MNAFLDARIPLVFANAAEAGPDDALLREGHGSAEAGTDWFQPAIAHAAGCACCAARTPAGLALSRLLLARARGQGPFFRRVLVITETQAGRHAVEAALANDPIAAGYFKEVVLF